MRARRADTPEPAPPAPAPSDPAVEVQQGWPLGHFYSPVPDTRELSREPAHSRIWPAVPGELAGIDWRPDAQVELVADVLATQPHLPFATAPTGDPTEYHTQNPLFSPLDAWVLQAMLLHLCPARMIEVGCGWSSLVTARVNREHRDHAMDFTCIEPYPPDFLAGGVPGISRLVTTPVQETSVDLFSQLGAGDVLFIDSSHVVKTGSDAQFLYHEVIPRLNAGVVVHIHDIFLPFDYPEGWVLSGRGWNEQYVLRSFLAFNDAFEVLLGVAWMTNFRPDVLTAAAPELGDPRQIGGGSLWIRRSRSPSS
jgi:Methyltransferase domain